MQKPTSLERVISSSDRCVLNIYIYIYTAQAPAQAPELNRRFGHIYIYIYIYIYTAQAPAQVGLGGQVQN